MVAKNFKDCTARQVYERTRNLSAFSVVGQYARRFKNQHCIGYVFSDGSTFLVYSDYSKSYRDQNGNMLARRSD